MRKAKDPYLEKILPPVVGALVGGIAGALATAFVFYLIPSAFGLRKEASINEIVAVMNENLRPQFNELKTRAGNIAGEFNRLGNQVTALEAKLEAIDRYILKELRGEAEKILGTSNVAIVRANETGFASDPTILWVPYNGSRGQGYAIICTVEKIKENVLMVRSAIKASDGQILDNKSVEMRLPPDVGKPITYSPRLQGMDASTVTFEIVLLRRLSPTELILATGLKGPSTVSKHSIR